MSLRYSFVIPARNAARTIGLCLESLRAMDYPRDGYEIIVVNDGSTDDTAAIAERHGARVISQACGSIPQVRNLGASNARGEVVIHLDSDMLVPPGYLRKADEYYGAGYDGCLSFALEVPEDANFLARLWYSPFRRRQHEHKEVDHLNSANLFVPKALIEKHGGLDEKLFARKRGGSDKEYTYRLNKAGCRMISDPSQRVVNLGYERSLWVFLRKEWWHQGNMLFIAKRHRFPFRLLRNPLVSLFHLIGLAAFVIALFTLPLGWALLVGLLWAAPSLLIILRQLPRAQWLRMAPALWGLTFLRWNAAGMAVLPQAFKLAREPWTAA